jgi:hypothetical protein
VTFAIKVRGAGGTILHEYLCDSHGRFEVLVDRVESPDEVPCPDCGSPALWSPSSAPSVHVQFVVSATQGKSDPKPHKRSMDTRSLGEGQRMSDWRKERKKVWEQERQERVKRMLE